MNLCKKNITLITHYHLNKWPKGKKKRLDFRAFLIWIYSSATSLLSTLLEVQSWKHSSTIIPDKEHHLFSINLNSAIAILFTDRKREKKKKKISTTNDKIFLCFFNLRMTFTTQESI